MTIVENSNLKDQPGAQSTEFVADHKAVEGSPEAQTREMSHAECDALLGAQSVNTESFAPHATDPTPAPPPLDLPGDGKVGVTLDNVFGNAGAPTLQPPLPKDE